MNNKYGYCFNRVDFVVIRPNIELWEYLAGFS